MRPNRDNGRSEGGKSDRGKSDRVRLRAALDTAEFGRSLKWYDSVPSTNNLAKRWADSGAPNGALVFADHQTGGRGRHGRSWIADPGLNLTVSLVVRPDCPPAKFGLITLAASMAVRAGIEACCPGVSARIKWPNDILIEDRKCCGMLLESAIGKDAAESFVILGIGINVNQASFPEPFDRTATSLMLGCGRPVDRMLFLADLLRRLEHLVHRIESSPDRVVREYEQALDAIGRVCTVTDVHSGARVRGVIRGVDTGGALRLETQAGVRLFHAGDVQMLTEAA